MEEFFLYKDKPLVRKDNILYYGDISDDFIAMLTIESYVDLLDVKIANKIFLQLISTNPDAAIEEVVVKHTIKNSLYEALDVAQIWIQRYTKKATVN